MDKIDLRQLLKMSIDSFKNMNFSDNDTYKNTILNYKYKDQLWKALLEFMDSEQNGTANIAGLAHTLFRDTDLSEDGSLGKVLDSSVDLSDNATNILNQLLTSNINKVDLTKANGYDSSVTNAFWNDSMSKAIATFNRYFSNAEYYEGGETLADEIPSAKKGTIYLSDAATFRIKDIKQANAGRSFTGTPWVRPYYNINSESYDQVRGADRITTDLKNSKEIDYTSLGSYLRLLMPRYERPVMVEDLNRNFWVIGQVLTGISAYLFSPNNSFSKMLEGILKEIIELWTNILYLWMAIAITTQQPKYTDIHKEVIYLSQSDLMNGLFYDNFEIGGLSAGVAHNTINSSLQESIKARCRYLQQSYPNSNLIIIPIIRVNNYTKGYYETECYPGYYSYDRNTERESFILFNENTLINNYLASYGSSQAKMYGANFSPSNYSGDRLNLLGFEQGNLDNYYVLNLASIFHPGERPRIAETGNTISFYSVLRSVPTSCSASFNSEYGPYLNSFTIEIYDVAKILGSYNGLESSTTSALVERRTWSPLTYVDGHLLNSNTDGTIVKVVNSFGTWFRKPDNNWYFQRNGGSLIVSSDVVTYPTSELSNDIGYEACYTDSTVTIDDESIDLVYTKLNKLRGFFMNELMSSPQVTFYEPVSQTEEEEIPEEQPITVIPPEPEIEIIDDSPEEQEIEQAISNLSIEEIPLMPIGHVPSTILKSTSLDSIENHGGRRDFIEANSSTQKKLGTANKEIMTRYANSHKTQSSLIIYLPQRKNNLSNRYWAQILGENEDYPKGDDASLYRGESNLLPYWYINSDTDKLTHRAATLTYRGAIFNLYEGKDNVQTLLNYGPKMNPTTLLSRLTRVQTQTHTYGINENEIPMYNRARDRYTYTCLLTYCDDSKNLFSVAVDNFLFAPTILPTNSELNLDDSYDLGCPVVQARETTSGYEPTQSLEVPKGRRDCNVTYTYVYKATKNSDVYYRFTIYNSYGTYVFSSEVQNDFSKKLKNLFSKKEDTIIKLFGTKTTKGGTSTWETCYCSVINTGIYAWKTKKAAENGEEPTKMFPLIHYVTKHDILIRLTPNGIEHVGTNRAEYRILGDNGAPINSSSNSAYRTISTEFNMSDYDFALVRGIPGNYNSSSKSSNMDEPSKNDKYIMTVRMYKLMSNAFGT